MTSQLSIGESKSGYKTDYTFDILKVPKDLCPLFICFAIYHKGKLRNPKSYEF
jgi:hypothetical protein